MKKKYYYLTIVEEAPYYTAFGPRGVILFDDETRRLRFCTLCEILNYMGQLGYERVARAKNTWLLKKTWEESSEWDFVTEQVAEQMLHAGEYDGGCL